MQYPIRRTAHPASSTRALWIARAALVLALFLLPSCAPIVLRAEGDPPESPREEILSAVVGVVSAEYTEAVGDQQQIVQEMELLVTFGPRRGDRLVVEHRVQPSAGETPYQTGDRVYVSEMRDGDAPPVHYIVGYARWEPLAWMAVAFVALVLWVGRGRGARSLLGLGVSFVVIFALVLPRLTAGSPPVTTALLGAALTLPASYLLAHGLNRKTAVAMVGSVLGLCLTGLLSVAFTALAHLGGYASEEATFLQALRPGAVDLRGLFLAGMVIGVLGVLDDVTVAQAAVVEQIAQANRALDWRQLYRRAMHVGQDHIASMVNTLVLVYAGSALPLLLLLGDQSVSPLFAVSHQVVAEEIVRMLVTSSSLIATVPITTLLAALVISRRPPTEAAAD